MNVPNIVDEPGWYGSFTRDQAEGALPNGTSIVKANSQPQDATPDGMRGTILGSIANEGLLFYFVEWDNRPKMAIGCMSTKVQVLQ